MSERRDNNPCAWTCGLLWVLAIIAIAALTGVCHYRAQIRDLQRRTATLEQQCK